MDEDLILAPPSLAMQPFDEALLLPFDEDPKTTSQSTGQERQASVLDTAFHTDGDAAYRQRSSWDRPLAAMREVDTGSRAADSHGFSPSHRNNLHVRAGGSQVRSLWAAPAMRTATATLVLQPALEHFVKVPLATNPRDAAH
jgi:hypothetical protein